MNENKFTKVARLKIQSSYIRNILVSNLADAGYMVTIVQEQVKDGFISKINYYVDIYEQAEVTK